MLTFLLSPPYRVAPRPNIKFNHSAHGMFHGILVGVHRANVKQADFILRQAPEHPQKSRAETWKLPLSRRMRGHAQSVDAGTNPKISRALSAGLYRTDLNLRDSHILARVLFFLGLASLWSRRVLCAACTTCRCETHLPCRCYQGGGVTH